MELDKTDVAILKTLQSDSRASFREISKQIGVSVPTISARVEKLEKLGIIKGYQTVIDTDKLGETTLIVLLKVAPLATDEMARRLEADDCVRRLYHLRGSRLMVEAVFHDSKSVDSFLNELSKLSGVVDYEHYISTRRIKEQSSAVVEESLVASLECYECRKKIEGDYIKKKLDGRDHYFCCRSCEKLYVGKYEKIKDRA